MFEFAQLTNFLLALLELLGIGIVGFFLSRGIYAVFLLIFNKLINKSRTTANDYITGAIKTPLQITTMFFCFFILAAFFDNLGLIAGLTSKYFLSILIVLFTYILSELIAAVLLGYELESAKNSTKKMDLSILPFVRKFFRVLIPLIGIAIGLSTIGVDLAGIFTLTSVIALILGLASQETLANLFAGLALQLDRPFYYKDYLKFSNGKIAQLRKIGFRTTKLEDLNGNKVTISNSEFAKQKLINLSRTYHNSNLSIPAEVTLETDIEELEKVLQKRIDSKGHEYIKKGSLRVLIDKVQKDSVQISVEVLVVELHKLNLAKDVINSEILKFNNSEIIQVTKHEKA
ncbi:MAG: mechanosensitive ion channel family protein [archaeon]|jgi:MscS family membrane protein